MANLKLSTCFAEVFATTSDLNFDSFYKGVQEYFNKNEMFFSSTGQDVFSRLWPKKPGVYVVWKTIGKGTGDVLYIGMTGKFTREGQLNPNAWLSKRQLRCHPYCFTKEGPYANHFEFGPRFGVDEIKRELPENRYSTREPLGSLRIDCFILGLDGKAAPVALESMFLQMYLEQFHKLPIANNEF